MDELDARLRAMAGQEKLSLPAEYEAAMENLEEKVRQGTLGRTRRPQGKRVLVLAAVVTVLLAATAVSADFWHVRLGEVSVGQEESRYDVEADLPGVHMEAFSQQVDDALEEIQQAFQEYQPWDSRYPGGWSRELDTWEACESFLGFSVVNPLEGQDELMPKTLNAHGEPFKPYEVSLHGNAEGTLEQLSVTAIYEFEEDGVSLQVIFLPEGRDSSQLTTGSVWKGEVSFETAETRTGSGAEVYLVTPQVEESDYYHAFSKVESCFILNGGLYLLDVSIDAAGEEAAAQALLDELLALF